MDSDQQVINRHLSREGAMGEGGNGDGRRRRETSSGVVFIMNTILVYFKDRSKKVIYLDFIQSHKRHQNRFGDPRSRIHHEYSSGLDRGNPTELLDQLTHPPATYGVTSGPP